MLLGKVRWILNFHDDRQAGFNWNASELFGVSQVTPLLYGEGKIMVSCPSNDANLLQSGFHLKFLTLSLHMQSPWASGLGLYRTINRSAGKRLIEPVCITYLSLQDIVNVPPPQANFF